MKVMSLFTALTTKIISDEQKENSPKMGRCSDGRFARRKCVYHCRG